MKTVTEILESALPEIDSLLSRKSVLIDDEWESIAKDLRLILARAHLVDPNRDLVKAFYAGQVGAHERNWEEFRDGNSANWEEEDARDIFNMYQVDGIVWTVEDAYDYNSLGTGATEEGAWESAAEYVWGATDDEVYIRAIRQWID